MPSREHLAATLEAIFGPDAGADGQVNGLQVEGRDKVEKVALAVSTNLETIEAAVAWGADALLTHHGMFWKGEPEHLRGVKRARVAKLLGADLNLFSYHLPLDAHPELGNNVQFFQKLGADSNSLRPAFPMKGLHIGQIWKCALPATELWARLKKLCPDGPLAHWDFGPAKIAQVGLVTGGAPWQLLEAIDEGVDAFITGEANEPIYSVAKEAGVHVFIVGHHASERFGVQALAAPLTASGYETRFFDVPSAY